MRDGDRERELTEVAANVTYESHLFLDARVERLDKHQVGIKLCR